MHRFKSKSMRQFQLNTSWTMMHTIVILIVVFILNTGKQSHVPYRNTRKLCHRHMWLSFLVTHLFLCNSYLFSMCCHLHCYNLWKRVKSIGQTAVLYHIERNTENTVRLCYPQTESLKTHIISMYIQILSSPIMTSPHLSVLPLPHINTQSRKQWLRARSRFFLFHST